MIIEVNDIPAKAKNTNGGQKGQIYRDIKDAISCGITKFELVDECYNYKYLPGYVREVMDRMIEREYIRDLWRPFCEELKQKYRNARGNSIRLDSCYIYRITRSCYTVRKCYDEELGRNRVFVTLNIDEKRIAEELKQAQKLVDAEHLEFLKKYYPAEARAFL